MIKTKLIPSNRDRAYEDPPLPHFAKPRPIACFSLDPEKQLVAPFENLKYLRLRPPGSFNYNLNWGFNIWDVKPHVPDNSSSLQFIMTTPEPFLDGSGKRLTADFFMNRGLLKSICVSPYDRKEKLSVLATKFRGTVYFLKYLTPEALKKEMAFEGSWGTYTGHNFERFVVESDPNSLAPPNPPIGPLEVTPFKVVYNLEIKSHKITCTAEVDGIEDDKENEVLEEMAFIELKTRGNYPLDSFKEFRFLNWWTQSYLVGIPKIYCGVRDRNGYVAKIEKWFVKDLPSMCQDYWSPAKVLNFGAEFLTLVNDVMAEVDCPKTVYKFNFEWNTNIEYEIFRGKNQLTFLPEIYTDFINNL